jgi:hypothetical protein
MALAGDGVCSAAPVCRSAHSDDCCDHFPEALRLEANLLSSHGARRLPLIGSPSTWVPDRRRTAMGLMSSSSSGLTLSWLMDVLNWRRFIASAFPPPGDGRLADEAGRLF